MTESDIITILSTKYCPPEWAFLSQLRNRTSYGGTVRTIDAFAIDCYASKGYRMLAFEVKISRNDFKNDVNDPEKREFFINNSTEFYYVVPQGLLRIDEVPEGCGLIEITAGVKNSVKVTKQAQQRSIKDDKISVSFIASILRNLDNRQSENTPLCKLAGKDITLLDVDAIIKERLKSAKAQGKSESYHEYEKQKEEDHFKFYSEIAKTIGLNILKMSPWDMHYTILDKLKLLVSGNDLATVEIMKEKKSAIIKKLSVLQEDVRNL